MIRLRKADASHLEGIIALCAIAHAEAPKWYPALSIEKVANSIGACLQDDLCAILVDDEKDVEKGGLVVGALCMRFNSLWFTEEKVIIEVFTFVHRDYRNYPNARKLYKAGMLAARIHNLPLIIAQFYAWKPEKMVKMFNRMGFNFLGPNGVYVP